MSDESSTEFVDYTFPAIGTFLTMRKEIVIMYFRVTRFSLNGADQDLTLRVYSISEEEAVKYVESLGYEIKTKWHFHEELKRLEDEVIKFAGDTAIVEEKPYEGPDRPQGFTDTLHV